MHKAERFLMDYVVAKSSPRMHHRARSPVSQDLLTVLLRVDRTEITRQHLFDSDPLTEAQLHRDRVFFAAINSQKVKQYLQRLGINTPHLFAASRQKTGFTFYHNETFLEIHDLIIAVLQDMHESIANIHKRTGAPKRATSPVPLITDAEEQRLQKIAESASLSAHLLWAFVYSSAAPEHFRRIYPLLETGKVAWEQEKQRAKSAKARAHSTKHNKPSKSSVAITKEQPTSGNVNTTKGQPNVGDVNLNISEEQTTIDDIDEELEPAAISVDCGEEDDNTMFQEVVADLNMPSLSLEYIKWFRRQVSHIEAIKTVCKMGRRLAKSDISPKINIQVLSVAFQGSTMREWQDVVHDIFSKPGRKTKDLNAESVIERLQKDGRMTSRPSSHMFRGTLHCEVCLASLLKLGLLNQDFGASRSLSSGDNKLIC